MKNKGTDIFTKSWVDKQRTGVNWSLYGENVNKAYSPQLELGLRFSKMALLVDSTLCLQRKRERTKRENLLIVATTFCLQFIKAVHALHWNQHFERGGGYLGWFSVIVPSEVPALPLGIAFLMQCPLLTLLFFYWRMCLQSHLQSYPHLPFLKKLRSSFISQQN